MNDLPKKPSPTRLNPRVDATVGKWRVDGPPEHQWWKTLSDESMDWLQAYRSSGRPLILNISIAIRVMIEERVRAFEGNDDGYSAAHWRVLGNMLLPLLVLAQDAERESFQKCRLSTKFILYMRDWPNIGWALLPRGKR